MSEIDRIKKAIERRCTEVPIDVLDSVFYPSEDLRQWGDYREKTYRKLGEILSETELKRLLECIQWGFDWLNLDHIQMEESVWWEQYEELVEELKQLERKNSKLGSPVYFSYSLLASPNLKPQVRRGRPIKHWEKVFIHKLLDYLWGKVRQTKATDLISEIFTNFYDIDKSPETIKRNHIPDYRQKADLNTPD